MIEEEEGDEAGEVNKEARSLCLPTSQANLVVDYSLFGVYVLSLLSAAFVFIYMFVYVPVYLA